MEAHHNYNETPLWTHQRKPSISMPTSPNILMISDPTTSLSSDNNNNNGGSTGKSVKFLSQPMTKVSSLYIETGNGNDDRRSSNDNHYHHRHQQHQNGHHQDQNPGTHKLKDNRYNSFKTWSGKLERQFTRKPASVEPEAPRNNKNLNTNEAMPVDRYYDALEGPELETLRVRTCAFFSITYDLETCDMFYNSLLLFFLRRSLKKRSFYQMIKNGRFFYVTQSPPSVCAWE